MSIASHSNDFDDTPVLRAEIRHLNDTIDKLRSENGDLGERLAVEIQKHYALSYAVYTMIVQHDLAAKRANFDKCGCDYCKALRPITQTP